MYPPVSSRSRILDPRLQKMRQFGGPLLKKSNAKTARPVSTKHVMHLVLRSSLARDAWSFSSSKNRKIISDIVRRRARELKIRIVDFSGSENTLHLLFRIRSRQAFHRFIRSITGEITMRLTGACKGQELKKSFWDFRPWTGIVKGVRIFSDFDRNLFLNYLRDIRVIPAFDRIYWRTLIREGP